MLKLFLIVGLFFVITTPSQAITNGYSPKEVPEWMAIVYTSGKPGTNLKKRFHCSGTLIAPNIVLSARHCGSAYSVELGSRKMGTNEEIRIKQVFDSPSWDRYYSDTALFLLEKSVPNKYLPVISKDTKIKEGDKIQKFGYGDQPSGVFGVIKGLKLIVQNSNTCGGSKLKKLVDICTSPYTLGRTCPGDSGSPGLVWIGDRLAVAAVLSGGGNFARDCKANSIDYNDEAVLNNPKISVWLQKTIKEQAGIDPFVQGEVRSFGDKNDLCRVPNIPVGAPVSRLNKLFAHSNCSYKLNSSKKIFKKLGLSKSERTEFIRYACRKEKRAIVYYAADIDFKKSGVYYMKNQLFKKGSRIDLVLIHCK